MMATFKGAPAQGADTLTATDSFTWTVTTAPVSSASTKNDFDGDGNSDLLWRNTSSGQNYVWFMDGGTRLSADPTQRSRTDLGGRGHRGLQR